MAPWKMMLMSVQRRRRNASASSARQVLARRSTTVPAGDAAVLGQQPGDGQRGRGLAAARLAHQTHRLAGVDVEADAVHRARPRRPSPSELDHQVADLEQGHRSAAPPLGVRRRGTDAD